MTILKWPLTVLTAAILAACGGGDSTPAAARADLYVGTVTSACEQTDEATYSGAPVFATLALKFSKIDSNVLKAEKTYSYFRDATCATSPLASIKGNPGDTMTIVGQTQVQLGNRTVTADKLDVLTLPLIPAIKAGDNINGLVFLSDSAKYADAHKNLSFVDGNTLYTALIDSDSPLDAAGYPTKLNPTADGTIVR